MVAMCMQHAYNTKHRYNANIPESNTITNHHKHFIFVLSHYPGFNKIKQWSIEPKMTTINIRYEKNGFLTCEKVMI